jgi:hypothetical protein
MEDWFTFREEGLDLRCASVTFCCSEVVIRDWPRGSDTGAKCFDAEPIASLPHQQGYLYPIWIVRGLRT